MNTREPVLRGSQNGPIEREKARLRQKVKNTKEKDALNKRVEPWLVVYKNPRGGRAVGRKKGKNTTVTGGTAE